MENQKPLDVANMADAKAKNSDIKVVGDPGSWKIVGKASSDANGWMKSTKAMKVGLGVLVQVTSEHRHDGKIISCAEALTYIPGAKLSEVSNNVVSIE